MANIMSTKKEVTLESLGVDKEVFYPLDFSKISYYKISLDKVDPSGTWNGEEYPPRWKGIKVEAVYSPPSKDVADRELKKIQDNPHPYAQRLKVHLLGMRDNTRPFIRESYYSNLENFGFYCKRGFKETILTIRHLNNYPLPPETESFVDRLRLFVNLVNSSKEKQALFQKTVGALNIVVRLINHVNRRDKTYSDVESYHIHHYQDGLCKLHQTTEDHNHEWLFEQYVWSNIPKKSFLMEEQFLQGELSGDYFRSYEPDSFPPYFYWMQSVQQLYWREMPFIDSSRLIDHFRLRYDADLTPIISIYYCKKGQEGKNQQEFEVNEYFPTPIDFMGLVSLIVKIMFFQQKYTYQIIPDHPTIQLDDWSPKEDWVPYPVPKKKKKKVKGMNYGEKALKQFVQDINENAYIQNIFKGFSFTIQFDLVEELGDIILKKFFHYYLICKSDGSCEYYEGMTLDDDQNPSYDFKFTTTLYELYRALRLNKLSDYKSLVRNINWEYESYRFTGEERRKMVQWAFALRKYNQIKRQEWDYYYSPNQAIPPKEKVPEHSSYWFILPKAELHSSCLLHSSSCFLHSPCWGYVKDVPLIKFLIENGKEISEEEFKLRSGPVPSHFYRLPPRFYQYEDVFWCANEEIITIFSLEKPLFNLAQEQGIDPLPLRQMPSYFTLEYYGFAPQGFAPAGVWDESVLELSRKYWYNKFKDSEVYYSWAYHSKFREMNPDGVGYRYAQRERGEKSSLLVQ